MLAPRKSATAAAPSEKPIQRLVAPTCAVSHVQPKIRNTPFSFVPFFFFSFGSTFIAGAPLFSMTVQLLDPFLCRVECTKDMQ